MQAGDLTLLDHLLPVWDAQRVERRVIDLPQAAAYDVALRNDFLDAVRDNRAVRTLFALRSMAERFAATLRRRAFREPPPPARLRLVDLPSRGEWIRLGDARPNEFVFGVAGRFWEGETTWLTMNRELFRTFEVPGYARIGCHLRFIALGPDRTQVEYVARTRTADPKSREQFLRYWMLVSPFVGFIMRVTLRAIERTAIRRPREETIMGAPPTPHAAVTKA